MQAAKQILLFVPLTLLAACQDSDESQHSSAEHEKAGSAVRAWVDQTAISQAQLDYALDRLTGGAIVPLDDAVHKKVLDSLIASRAMSLLAEKEMEAKEKERLALQVQAYREELLVKAYIDRHATPAPVTSDMVKQYYQDNLEEFGGKQIKSFEYITSVGALDDDVRRELAKNLETLSQNPGADLTAAVEKLKQKGFAVKYKNAEMVTELVEDPIRSLLQKTAPTEFAPIYNQTDGVVLLRVNTSKFMDAQVLGEVAADIRKKLAPMQLKKAVVDLVSDAKQQVDIKHKEKIGE